MDTTKIDNSIKLLQKAEKLALAMQPNEGFHLSFSGGKDSQTILELAKMAGIKYKAYYYATTIDPAENVSFIKQYYPDVTFLVPKESFLHLVSKKGLPTRQHRFCCTILKETQGLGSVVLTGVRKEESTKRQQYAPLTKYTKKKEERKPVFLNEMEQNQFQCVNGSDKFLLHPILEWSTMDVLDFLSGQKIPQNPCYIKNKRVGCSICPFAPRIQNIKYLETHPKFKAALISSIGKYLSKSKKYNTWSPEDCLNWWTSGKSLEEYFSEKKQLTLNFPIS